MATTSITTTKSPTTFLDRQINTYGMPASGGTNYTAQTTPVGQAAPTPATVMPNGQPQPYQGGSYMPYQPQQAGTVGTVNNKGVYSGGSAPTAQYQQQIIPQWQAPNTGQIGQQTQQMMQQYMQNPYTFSPQVLSQMKGTFRDQAALMEKQTLGQMMGSLGSRGIDPNSKYGLSMQRAEMGNTNRNILNNNRAIDIQAALQNQKDIMQAINMGNQYEDSVFGRAAQGYGMQLQGIGMQGQEQQRFLDSIARNYQLGLQGAQLGSSSALGAEGNRLTGRGQDLQNSQFYSNLDWQRDSLAQQLAAQRSAQGRSLGQADDHFNQQMAFQYQQAQQREYDNLMQYLMSGGTY